MCSRWLSQYILFALWLLHLIVFAPASPLLRHGIEDFGRPPSPGLSRRQNPTIVTTGINTFGVQPRLEIRKLEENADQWNIFLLGLRRFQLANQNDSLSYYQIAGIHGRPYSPYNDVPAAPGSDSPGYCMHVLNLFLTWHRPYLALFEQTLYQHIVDAVNEFPAGAQRQRYASAALSWRFPYFDWAAPPPEGEGVFPASLQSPTVTVTMPNGTSPIPNPLYSYQFHPVEVKDFYFNPFASWSETKRYPPNWDLDAPSQNALIGPVLDNSRVSFQDRLYNLFTNYDNFTEFGNEAWMNPGVRNADSLESIHDVIHSIIGSNGHMTYLDYSAFDPSFWLHHAMVDRCFALWQALYPDSYVEPMVAIEETFTIKVGDVKTQDSALEPFFSDSNRDYWTAASVRSTRTSGYTYPELVGDNNISSVKAAINKLYGSSAGSSGLSKRSHEDVSLKQRAVANAASLAQTDTIPDEVVDGKFRQYLANVLSQKFALNRSYAIYLFMGEFNDTPSAWAISPNLVGTHAVFAAMSVSDASSKSQSRMGRTNSAIHVTGTMPLTSMLLAKAQSGELENMTPETVEDYLTDNLHWRVGLFDGTEVSAEEVADLTVTVVTAQVEPASSADEFPRWSDDFTPLTRITRGKPGGC